jgi:TonB family protein
MNRCKQTILMLLAAGLSLAGAAAQVPTDGGLIPSRALAGTHSCVDFYPDAARRLNQSGDVLIGYDVGADGAVGHVTLLKSSGSALLDQAAVQCVTQRWRNTPAMQNGVPVASSGHRAIVRFTLHEASYFGPPGTAQQVAAAPDTNPQGWLLLYLAVGTLSMLVLIVLALRQWVFVTQICPSCSAHNRSLVPFTAPKYCSRCGTRIPPEA